MAFNIEEFKAQGLRLGGARPTLFQCDIFSPPGVGLAGFEQFRFLCKATSLPESDVGAIPVPYMGRQINVSGDRVFKNWQVLVMNDEDFTQRSAFERWSNALNSHVSNLRLTEEGGYKAEVLVSQLGKSGNLLRQYNMVGVFPTIVGTINLDWAEVNRIEEFTVQLAMDYWVPLPGPTRNPFTGRE